MKKKVNYTKVLAFFSFQKEKEDILQHIYQKCFVIHD